MLLLQNILYCLLYMLLVKCVAKDSGQNCLFFYPKEYIDEADRRGIADKDATMKKGKQFMIFFCLTIFLALFFIIAGWNHVRDFKTAYLQSALFLVVVNWFDGIVIDRWWVSHGRIWKIEGMEDMSFVKSWKTVLVKRSLATIMYLVLSFAVAGIVVGIGKIW